MNKFLKKVMPIVGLLILIVNIFIGEPELLTLEDRAGHYSKNKNYRALADTYKSLIKQDSLNYHYHFEYIVAHFKRSKDKFRLFSTAIQRNDKEIIKFYKGFKYSDDARKQDLGNWALGLCYLYTQEINLSVQHFEMVKNRDIPYINYIYGELWSTLEVEDIERYFLREIEIKGDSAKAYHKLGALYYENDCDSQLKDLLADPKAEPHVSRNIKRHYYLRYGEWGKYWQLIWGRLMDKANPFGVIGAILIALVWLIYLQKIDFYKAKRWPAVIVVLFLGMFFAFGTSILTDINKYIVGFTLNQDVVNDFVYSVIGIGAIEELVKIVPLLLILLFTRIIKEPIDYIVFASVSALGFALIENIIYFEVEGLKNIQGRALSATVSHMFDSSIIAYGLMLAKYGKRSYPLKGVVNFLIFFVLASITHGFYDFWLLNPRVKSLMAITFVFLLISMFVWSTLINNCLNNSSRFLESKRYDPNRLNTYLLYSLSAIFLFEYLVVAINFGASFANQQLFQDLITGLFLLIFLTFSLSRFDLVRSYWAPIRVWDWQTIFNVPRLEPVVFNLDEIIGREVVLTPFRDSSPLDLHLPVRGKIISREVISWEKEWYLVHLENPINIGWKMQEYILIKLKDGSQIIYNDSDQVVIFRLVNDLELLNKKRKLKKDFPFIDFVVVN